jgi:poly-gamma-glutamate synthesis protein (capsule biosynthesis protein)
VVESAEILKSWGIMVVSLANNHMFDYGWEGFKETQRLLDKAGISYVGAGKDLQQACRPLIVEIKGTKIGLLAYSWQFVQTTCATENSYGCAPLETGLIISQIRKLRSNSDAVIVLPHWGYCEYPFPVPQQVELGKRMIKAGATAVIGHHSHVVQGVVEEEGQLLAYSLGNFVFAEYSDRGRAVRLTEDNTEGVILKIGLVSGRVASYNVIFTVLRDDIIQIDNSSQRLKKFARRSEPLKLKDYSRYWRRFVRRRMVKRILYWANIFNWRHIHKETFIGGWLMVKALFRVGRKRDSDI